MTDYVKRCFDRIYVEKDFDYFRKSCQKPYHWIELFEEQCQNLCQKLVKSNIDDLPQVCFYAHFPDMQEAEFHVHYRTLVGISKVAKLYYIEHSFEVKNRDPERLDPTLYGFSDSPYCFKQYHFEEFVVKFMEEHEVNRLFTPDQEEVVTLKKLPENRIFGTQLTVYNALFEDIYDIYHSDSPPI